VITPGPGTAIRQTWRGGGPSRFAGYPREHRLTAWNQLAGRRSRCRGVHRRQWQLRQPETVADRMGLSEQRGLVELNHDSGPFVFIKLVQCLAHQLDDR
jgi:hypothetical protein